MIMLRRTYRKRLRDTTATAAGVLLIVTALTGCDRKDNSATGTMQLVVASYGGAWQDAQRKAMFEPFAKQAPIIIKEAVYDGQYAAIKEMVRVGRAEWDVVDVEGNMVELGRRD